MAMLALLNWVDWNSEVGIVNNKGIDNRSFLRLALPLIAIFLITAVSNFVAVVFVAHLGKEALAASALTLSVFGVAMVFAYGFLSVISVFVAQGFGAEKADMVGYAAAQGVIVAIVVGLVLFAVLYIAPQLFFLSKVGPKVITLATSYAHALAWSILPLAVLMALQQFFISINKANLIMIVSAVEAPCEILACYLLAFGHWGLPRLGIAGLGYGFAVIYLLVILFLLLLLLFRQEYRRYRFYYYLIYSRLSYFKELIQVGLPLGVNYIVATGAYIVLALLMGHFGAAALAAHQIARQFAGYTFMIASGCSQAITILVGQSVGRRSVLGVRYSLVVGLRMGLLMMLPIAVAYLLLPQMIIGIDLSHITSANYAVFKEAVPFLMLVGVGQILEVVRTSMLGGLRGLKDTKVPMYITAIAYWLIALPLGGLLAFGCHLDGIGLWLGMLIGIAACALILGWRFQRLASNDYLHAA